MQYGKMAFKGAEPAAVVGVVPLLVVSILNRIGFEVDFQEVSLVMTAGYSLFRMWRNWVKNRHWNY